MATTVQEVYDDVCRALLEDGALVFFYSEAAFLTDILVVIQDFLQKTGVIKNTYDIRILSGTSSYTVAEDASDVQEAFVDKKYLQPSSEFYLDMANRTWGSDTGAPERWHRDQLSDRTIEVTPTPNFSGAVLPDETRNLKLIATQIPTQSSLALVDNIPLMPDTMAAYLKFGVLEKIFNQDGEARDIQRARYCNARVTECLNAFRAVMQEEALEEIDASQ